MEAKGTGEFRLSTGSGGPMAAALGLETGAMVERQKSKASHAVARDRITMMQGSTAKTWHAYHASLGYQLTCACIDMSC